MIDFHNHILPNVDDGPKTIEESISMLKHASIKGITEVVQTVHFQHPKMDNKNVDYKFLKNEVEKLESQLSKHNIKIKIHLTAEVFYLPNLTKLVNNKLTTLSNKFILVEFSSSIFPRNYEEEFYKIQNMNFTPIIAHPERYRFVQNDLSIINDWVSKDFIIQLDAGSLIGHFGKKVQDISWRIVDKYGFHLLGSDAHNNRKRNFCLPEAYNMIDKKYNSDIVLELKNNASLILKGDFPLLVKNKHNNSLYDIIKSKFRY